MRAVDAYFFLECLVIFLVEQVKTVGLWCGYTAEGLAGDEFGCGRFVVLADYENLLVVGIEVTALPYSWAFCITSVSTAGSIRGLMPS